MPAIESLYLHVHDMADKKSVNSSLAFEDASLTSYISTENEKNKVKGEMEQKTKILESGHEDPEKVLAKTTGDDETKVEPRENVNKNIQKDGELRKSKSLDIEPVQGDRNNHEMTAFVAQILREGSTRIKMVKEHLKKEHKRRHSTPGRFILSQSSQDSQGSQLDSIKENDPTTIEVLTKDEECNTFKDDMENLTSGLEKVNLTAEEEDQKSGTRVGEIKTAVTEEETLTGQRDEWEDSKEVKTSGSHFEDSIGLLGTDDEGGLTRRGLSYSPPHYQFPNNNSPYMQDCDDQIFSQSLYKVPSPTNLYYVHSPQHIPPSPDNLMLLQNNGSPHYHQLSMHNGGGYNQIPSPHSAYPASMSSPAISKVVSNGLLVSDDNMTEEFLKQMEALSPEPSMVSSPPEPQTRMQRIPVENEWPDADSSPAVSPRPTSDGPPSVGSSVFEDVDMYAASQSPGSTGSVVNSPRAMDQWSNQGSPSSTQCQETVSSLFVKNPSNENFGTVLVNKRPQHKRLCKDMAAAIQEIKEDLTMFEKTSLQSLPPFRSFVTAPPKRQRSSVPYLQQISTMPPQRTRLATDPITTHMGYNSMVPHAPINPTTSGHISIRQAVEPTARVTNSLMQQSCPPVRCIPVGPPVTEEEQQMRNNIMMLSNFELDVQYNQQPYEGETLLQIFILNGQRFAAICMIERMYLSHINLNKKNQLGQTALLLAVVQNMPEVVEKLVMCGADVMIGCKQGTFPLHYAASHNFCDIIRAIYKCASSYPPNLENLDFNAPNFEGKTPLICAVDAHYTQQEFYSQDDAPQLAVVNNYEMIELLLEVGADPLKGDASSRKTPLIYAIVDCKLDIIKLLLESRLIMDPSKLVQHTMSDGNTALHIAVGIRHDEEKKLKIIYLLYSNGADVGAQNYEGHRPQHVITKGHNKIVKYFQEKINNRRTR